MERDSTASLPRATALLLVLLSRLQQRWRLQSDLSSLELQLRTAGVSAAPSAVFTTTDTETTVDVRGLEIGDKLFVHFVSTQTALRLDLAMSEYVKQSETEDDLDPRQHTRVGQWTMQCELLQWRLDRNVYPEFAGSDDRRHASASADAELGRLPEPLLLQLAPFLSAVDFCGVTQTNQFLRQFADNTEIWREYFQHDFPPAAGSTATATANPKQSYIARHTHAQRLRDTRRSLVQSGLLDEGDDLFGPPRVLIPAGPRVFIPPGLRQPGLIPPPFVGQWRRPNGGHTRVEDW